MSTTKRVEMNRKGLFSVERFRFRIKKDNVAWTGIDSIALTFEKPDRTTEVAEVAVVDDDSEGLWRFDSVGDGATGDLDTVGYWRLNVKVTDGTIVKNYPYEIGFFVGEEP